MAAADVVGTWFPTGYYGHYRSKTRNDILQEYRHEATPLPPKQFVKWVRKSPDFHRFSKHDNRHSYQTDATYFDSGMGRRRGKASLTAFNPELMAWMPHKEAIAREGASVSLYRLDFRPGGKQSNEPLPQRLSPRIRQRMSKMEATDARLKWVSDFKQHFCHGQPDSRINTDISTGKIYDKVDHSRSHQYVNKTGKLTKVVPPYLAHTRRRVKSVPPVRYSVGDCLVWNTPQVSPPQPRYSVLLGTATTPRTQFAQPHPPTESSPDKKISPPITVSLQPQQTTTEDSKKIAPAATAISDFTPMQSLKTPPA